MTTRVHVFEFASQSEINSGFLVHDAVLLHGTKISMFSDSTLFWRFHSWASTVLA